jgi:hypothetical protein
MAVDTSPGRGVSTSTMHGENEATLELYGKTGKDTDVSPMSARMKNVFAVSVSVATPT